MNDIEQGDGDDTHQPVRRPVRRARWGLAVGAVAILGLVGAALVRSVGDGDPVSLGAGDATVCSGGDDLVVLTEGSNGEASVEALDPGAASLRRISGDDTTTKPSLSPDGRSVVVVHAEGDYESAGPDSTALWVLDLEGGPHRELTDGASQVDEPAWSPDGSTIAFREFRDGRSRLMTMPAEGGAPTELLPPGPGGDHLPTWSPDGARLAFIRNGDEPPEEAPPSGQLWTVAPDGSEPALVAAVDEWTASLTWNPDGRTLLVGADDHGLFLVVPDVDGTGHVTKVADSGSLPTWSRDGRRLYVVQFLPDPSAAPPVGEVLGPDGEADERVGRSWAVVEARLDGDEVVPVRHLHDYGFLYGYYGLTVGPCRAGTVATTVPPEGLPAPSTTTTTPMDDAVPTCAAAAAFAAAVTAADVDPGARSEPSPSVLAEASDVTARGTLTGEVEVFPAKDGFQAQVGIGVLVDEPLGPDRGVEPGSVVVLMVLDAEGDVAHAVDGIDLRGTPVVVSALASNRAFDDGRVHIELGVVGAATACDGAPPIGRLGTGDGWSGLTSLDLLAAATDA